MVLYLTEGGAENPAPETIDMGHFKLRKGLYHFQDRLLRQVLGQMVVEGQTVDIRRDLLPHLFGHSRQTLHISGLCLPDRLDIQFFRHLAVYHIILARQICFRKNFTLSRLGVD